MPTANETAGVLPVIRVAAVCLSDGREAILAEISAPAPPVCAVAITLDMSDSCGLIDRELQRAPKLLGLLPRHWPLWLYRLSDAASLASPGVYQLGDLIDGSLCLTDILNDSRHSDIGRHCGSLIRPVVESVEKLRIAERTASVFMLLFTDGELLDVAPVDVPDGVDVIGLAPQIDRPKHMHWSRVLPGCPLYTLSDPRLDHAMEAESYPFYGACDIQWRCSENHQVRVSRLDRAERALFPANDSQLSCNLRDGPTYLMFETTRPTLPSIRLACRSCRNGRTEPLPWPRHDTPFGDDVLVVTASAVAGPEHLDAEIILDVEDFANDFDIVLKSIQMAARFAADNEKWIDDEGLLRVFRDPHVRQACSESGRPTCDAVLCCCRGEPTGVAREGSRIVLFALSRRRQPALRCAPEKPFSFATPVEPFEVAFDPQRERWMLTRPNGEPEELEPYGSERLGHRLFEESNMPWVVLFSGNLR